MYLISLIFLGIHTDDFVIFAYYSYGVLGLFTHFVFICFKTLLFVLILKLIIFISLCIPSKVIGTTRDENNMYND